MAFTIILLYKYCVLWVRPQLMMRKWLGYHIEYPSCALFNVMQS